MANQEPVKRKESVLQEYWSNLPAGTEFTTSDGHVLRVVMPGYLNKHAGPDFPDACIEIDGTLRRGSVEMHCRTTDWIAHGHSGNPDYADVILHVVMEDDSAPGSVAFLPDIPVLCIDDVLLKRAQTRENEPDSGNHLCAPFFAAMAKDDLRRFLEDAGRKRLHGKALKLIPDFIAYGGQKTFLAALAAQYGVPDNREAFLMLGKRLFAYPDEVLREVSPAVIWGESGLLPDPSLSPKLSEDGRALANDLWKQWWPIRPDAGASLKFLRRCRPLNSPERRIAALTGWARAFSADPLPLLRKIVTQGDYDKAIAELAACLRTDDFWQSHTSFKSKPLAHPAELFSKSRLDALMIDVLLPYLLAYAKLHRDAALEKQIFRLYTEIPPLQSNQTIRLMQSACFPDSDSLLTKAAIQQGMIHIYRKYCCEAGNYCLKCSIYRSFSTD